MLLQDNLGFDSQLPYYGPKRYPTKSLVYACRTKNYEMCDPTTQPGNNWPTPPFNPPPYSPTIPKIPFPRGI